MSVDIYALFKTPVTRGRMYHRITVGYQVWEIVSDLRIIFFICEHVHTIRNILLAFATDVMRPWGHHRKIKLLEFSVKKSLRILGVIKIRITSVCNPQSVRNVLTADVHVLESSVPMKTWKMYTNILGGCWEAVRTLSEVYGDYRKPQGSIGMVVGEGHGHEICLRIITDIPGGVYRQ